MWTNQVNSGEDGYASNGWFWERTSQWTGRGPPGIQVHLHFFDSQIQWHLLTSIGTCWHAEVMVIHSGNLILERNLQWSWQTVRKVICVHLSYWDGLSQVGYIKFGKFHKLFNARLPLNDPSNQQGFPDGHVPLQLGSDNTSIDERTLSECYMWAGANLTTRCVLPSHRQSHSYLWCLVILYR